MSKSRAHMYCETIPSLPTRYTDLCVCVCVCMHICARVYLCCLTLLLQKPKLNFLLPAPDILQCHSKLSLSAFQLLFLVCKNTLTVLLLTLIWSYTLNILLEMSVTRAHKVWSLRQEILYTYIHIYFGFRDEHTKADIV